ncbi:MAG: dihydropteroate synthase [Peptococcaceae bacterium]|nr:dihydropteroate synthase [Peptococcaceae bacterium]
MLIVGERLNSTILPVREAICNKDTAFVQDLARKQVEGGADLLDVNTAQGTNEVEDMEWLVRTVQEVVDVPLCIDSVDPDVVKKALQIHRGKAMLNSISMEKSRLAGMLPLIKEYGCSVVALTMDDNGIPKTAEERIKIAGQLADVLAREKIDLSEVYVDPLVLPLAVSTDNALIFFQCLAEIKKMYGFKTISGLSNVSHSLPKRKLINRYFLTICMSHGMDAAIMDPLDRKLTSAAVTTELLLNKDRFARNYLKAYRSEALVE